MKNFGKLSLLIAIAVGTFACSGGEKKQASTKSNETETSAYGVGPIKEVSVGDEIDQELAAQGQKAFETKCIACHSFEKRLIGPSLQGTTAKRNHAWIMNMIINPVEMTQKDPIAKDLLKEYGAQMVSMNVNKEEARAILEYMRSKDAEAL